MKNPDKFKLIKLILVAAALIILLIMISLIAYGKTQDEHPDMFNTIDTSKEAISMISDRRECTITTSTSVVNVNTIKETTPEQTIEWHDGYTTCRVNIREFASTASAIIETLEFNQHILWADYEDSWYRIQLDDNTYFISSAYVAEEAIPYQSYRISSQGFKSFMPYTAITSKTSCQYKIQHNFAYTGDYGIRQVNSRFCVALGSAIDAPIGTYVDLVLKNEEVIPCILADQKADKDTGSDNLTTQSNGCVSEFLVDMSSLVSDAKIRGDISYVNDIWNSAVVEIRVYDYNIFED